MRGKLPLLVLSMAICLLVGLPAAADTYSFSYSGTGDAGTFNGSGTFDVSLITGDEYQINSISGTQNGDSMMLLAPGAFGANDNLFFSNAPYLDESGVSFIAGGVDYNIYFTTLNGGAGGYIVDCPVGSYCATANGLGTPSTTITGSFAAVPEPSSLTLLGGGLIGIGVRLRKRFAR